MISSDLKGNLGISLTRWDTLFFLSVQIIEIQLYFYICLWCEESLDLTSCQDLLVFPTSGGLWFRPDQSLLDAITDGIDEVFSESPI